MRRSDFDVFVDKFEPQMTDEGDLKKWETYGEEFEEVKKLGGDYCEYLWTIVEGDNDKWYICPGFHLVNRMCYVITKKPWTENQRDYLYS